MKTESPSIGVKRPGSLLAVGALMGMLQMPDYGGGLAYEQIMENDSRGISKDINIKVQINRPRGWKKRQRKLLAARSDKAGER